MFIKNITDEKTPKVIGIGKDWLLPGEEKYFPDESLYVPEYDKYGVATGKKIILPAITGQVKLNMLKITEDKVARPAKEEEVEEPMKEVEEPVVSADEPAKEAPAKTTRTRKAKA